MSSGEFWSVLVSSLVLKVALVLLLPPVPLVGASFVSSLIYWGFEDFGKGRQSRLSPSPPPHQPPYQPLGWSYRFTGLGSMGLLASLDWI